MRLITLSLCLYVAFTLKAFSQVPPIIIDDAFTHVEIGKNHLRVLEDKSRTFTLTDVLKKENTFVIPPNDRPNFGYTSSAYWSTFTIQNSYDTGQLMNLVVDFPILDSLEFYILDEQNQLVKQVFTGDLVPFQTREMQVPNYAIELNFQPQQQLKVFLRIRTRGTLNYAIHLWTPKTYAEQAHVADLGFGIYYGTMIVMLLYNLFIFLTLREKSYLFYLFNICSVILFQLSFNGIGFQFLWPNLPAFNDINIPFFIAMLIFTSINFTREFLNTRSILPKWDKLFLGIMAYMALVMVLTFLIPYRTVIKLSVFGGLPAIALVISVAFISLRKGFQPAKFFIVAWAVFIIGAALTALRAFGVLPPTFLTVYSIQIGSALEVVLLSLALADKINTLRRELAEKAIEKERIEREKEIEKREYIEEQNAKLEYLVEERTKKLAEKNKQITDSIRYAKRIQQAILPPKHLIQGAFPNSFIYFKPRDIVSGDFYWFAEKNDKVIVAAVDCTGHGVPGAFMSLIGNVLLNQIVIERNITTPATILDHLHLEVRQALKQSEEDDKGSKDGMDLALCVLHKKDDKLEFAGAHNSLFMITKGELIEIKGDKFGIGGAFRGEDRAFTNHLIDLHQDETTVYLASDGYPDQFGGPKNMKFMSKRFKKMLIDISNYDNLRTQQLQLSRMMEEWQGKQKQTDDQLIIGFKVNTQVVATAQY